MRLPWFRNSLAAAAIGKPAGEVQVAVRAKTGVTLSTNADPSEGASIGGDKFRFTIRPTGKNDDGTFAYSDWATAFMAQLRSETGIPGVQLVLEDKDTGDRLYSMTYIQGNANSLNQLQLSLLQQAVPSDVTYFNGLYTIYTRNFLGVEAPDIKATGKNIMIASEQDLKLGDNAIQGKNITLATTGTITGSLQSSGGVVSLHAGKGIGSKESFFSIGGSSTYTVGSDADIYLKTTGREVNLASLTGQHLTIDTREAALKAKLSAAQPHIVGRRIDFYGNLDTGLNFRTFGTSKENGGLHWHGGSSSNLKFGALNTAYTFWFVPEGETASSIGKVNVSFSGHLVVGGLSKDRSNSFRQVGARSKQNVIEFATDQVIANSLNITGENAFTVRSAQTLALSSGASLNLNGDATLQLAGIDNVDDSTILINSTGNLGLCGYTQDSTCEFMDAVSINGSGNVSLDNVSSTGLLSVNAREGIHGEDVSGPQIIANSANGGVFLNADTADLSGSSRYSFVADLEPVQGGRSVTVHDINVDDNLSKVIIKSISDKLLLDGLISGAVLEFYCTGDIDKDFDAILDSDYPFWNVWREYDPSVSLLDINSIEKSLSQDYTWLLQEISNDASQRIDDVQRLRRKLNGEEDNATAPELRFLDKDGNTVSRDEYANLITNK